ncbi:putative ribonuclease H-like domain-containing protein [Tanacetum coccineum]
MVPRTVLTRSGPISVNTVQSRTIVNNAGPMKNVINNAYSTAKRPFNKITTANNSNFTKNVNTVKGTSVNTARPKAVISVVKGNKGNVVKASACWVWRPKHKILDHGNSQQDSKNKGVIDSGCSRHMTGNRSYLTDYKEIDGRFVAFGGNSKGGKITGKGIENLIDLRVKVIRCDNRTEFKNRVMNQFCEMKGNQSNSNAGTKACADTGKARVETVPDKNYMMVPLWTQDPSFSSSPKDSPDAGFKPSREEEKKDAEDPRNKSGNLTEGKDSEVPSTKEPRINQEKDDYINSTNNINTASDGNSTNNVNAINDDKDVGAEVDMNNLDAFMLVNPIPTTRIHKDHPFEQIIEDLNSAPQTRRMTKNLKEHEEPKKTLVDLPNGKRAIGIKWVYRNKKDERGIVIKNKARLVAQEYTQEKGIDYDEVFTPVARIEAIRLFLAYASFKDFVAYQMDVKSVFLYGKIEEEVYVCQPPRFEDPNFPDRVYKVEKVLYGLHQAPRAWYVDDIIFGSTNKKLCTKFKKMIHKKFQKSSMGELILFLGLQVKQKEDGIFISQDKYVTEILKKFSFSDVKTANTPMKTHKPLLKYADGEDVDKHIYLKGQPKLGLGYPKDSPFDLVAYTDSDYTGESLDRKSTI